MVMSSLTWPKVFRVSGAAFWIHSLASWSGLCERYTFQLFRFLVTPRHIGNSPIIFGISGKIPNHLGELEQVRLSNHS